MEWRKPLQDKLKGRVAVVCIGNRLRGDDALGPALADDLESTESMVVFNCETVPENFLGPIVRSAPDTVVVVDSADFKGEPGEIRLFEKEDLGHVGFSTHAISPSLFMSLVAEQTGADCFLIAVQGREYRQGAASSAEVNRARDQIHAALLAHGRCTP